MISKQCIIKVNVVSRSVLVIIIAINSMNLTWSTAKKTTINQLLSPYPTILLKNSFEISVCLTTSRLPSHCQSSDARWRHICSNNHIVFFFLVSSFYALFCCWLRVLD